MCACLYVTVYMRCVCVSVCEGEWVYVFVCVCVSVCASQNMGSAKQKHTTTVGAAHVKACHHPPFYTTKLLLILDIFPFEATFKPFSHFSRPRVAITFGVS